MKSGKLLRENARVGKAKGVIARKGVIERKQFATKHSQYLYVENGYRVGYLFLSQFGQYLKFTMRL